MIKTTTIGGVTWIEDTQTEVEQPFPSWSKHTNEFGSYWDAPIPCPSDNKTYKWSELTLTWEEV
jgi:hypothetical protein